MKGDFSRITFDALNHFSRVLMQQGRVTIDADPNEQAAILLHYIRTLARDLIGPRGGPYDALGFQLRGDPATKPATIMIGAGRYYVDGFLCENEQDCSYASQPDYIPRSDDPLLAELRDPNPSNAFWLYLDVWERHITSVEDDRIREVALGGPDTCTRAKVIWQVKARLTSPAGSIPSDPNNSACTGPLGELFALGAAQMAAELDPGQQIPDPCVVAPDARFRGAENQLYRIEIHQVSSDGKMATFKWSRNNGSVASAWLGTEGNDLVVANARGFSASAWVELSDDTLDLLGEPGVLVKLSSVDGNRLSVDPSSVPASASLPSPAGLSHPKVRRWDQTENDDITLVEGAIPIVEATGSDPHWFALEDGLRVRFQLGTEGQLQYRTGDYWLIPARVATGDIEWPRTGSTADFLRPRGIEHHFAPVGGVQWNSENQAFDVFSCLCKLEALTPCSRFVTGGTGDATTTRKPLPQAKVPTPTPTPAPATTRPQASGSKSSGTKPK